MSRPWKSLSTKWSEVSFMVTNSALSVDVHSQYSTCSNKHFDKSATAGGGVLGRLRSSTLSPSSSTPRRSRGVLELGRGVLELKLHEEESKYTEA